MATCSCVRVFSASCTKPDAPLQVARHAHGRGRCAAAACFTAWHRLSETHRRRQTAAACTVARISSQDGRVSPIEVLELLVVGVVNERLGVRIGVIAAALPAVIRGCVAIPISLALQAAGVVLLVCQPVR